MEPSCSSARGLYSCWMIRIAILIDGGHLRVLARRAGFDPYDPSFIEKIALACVNSDEIPLRFLYYDCAPYVGKTKLPVSGSVHELKGNDGWLKQLASKDLFGLREGRRGCCRL